MTDTQSNAKCAVRVPLPLKQGYTDYVNERSGTLPFGGFRFLHLHVWRNRLATLVYLDASYGLACFLSRLRRSMLRLSECRRKLAFSMPNRWSSERRGKLA